MKRNSLGKTNGLTCCGGEGLVLIYILKRKKKEKTTTEEREREELYKGSHR